MSDSILAARRAGLEEAFFAQHDAELLAKVREADAQTFRKQALAAATGIVDDAVLARLEQLKIGTGTLAALTLVPMVLVAWADGTIAEEERRAVLAGATRAGLAAGSPGLELLEAWLHVRPQPALFQAWKDYVHALVRTMSAAERASLEASVLDQTRAVAAATGSFMGLTSPISATEKAVLAEAAAAFHAA